MTISVVAVDKLGRPPSRHEATHSTLATRGLFTQPPRAGVTRFRRLVPLRRNACLPCRSRIDRLRSCWGLLCAGSLPCFQIAPLEKSRQPGLYLNSIVIFRHRFGNLIEPCHCGPRCQGALTPEENGKMSDSQQEHEFERVSSQNEITPALLHAWRSRMRRWCARELGGAYASRMDTSDVVQESLLQVWQDWDRFRGNSSGEVKSWMFRIAKGASS